MRAMLGGCLAIAMAWVAFGGVHSLLARESAKGAAERLFGLAFFAGGYRLLYNLIAAASFGWLWLLPRSLAGDVPLVALPEPLWLLPYLIKAGAVTLGIFAFRRLRTEEFLGIGQFLRWLRGELNTPSGAPAPVQAPEPLTWQGPYLWVRHPLNTATIVWFWAQPAYTLYNVLFAAMLTGYILAANVWEERDLLRLHGAAYMHYREHVPAFWSGFRGLAEREQRMKEVMFAEATHRRKDTPRP